MTDKEKEELIMQEVKKMYADYFERTSTKEYYEKNRNRGEIESYKQEKIFIDNVKNYIKKRKKELGLK